MTEALTPTEKSKKQRDNTKNATKNFDYTTIADRLILHHFTKFYLTSYLTSLYKILYYFLAKYHWWGLSTRCAHKSIFIITSNFKLRIHLSINLVKHMHIYDINMSFPVQQCESFPLLLYLWSTYKKSTLSPCTYNMQLQNIPIRTMVKWCSLHF